MAVMKLCKKCGKEKDIKEFYSGFSYCKSCSETYYQKKYSDKDIKNVADGCKICNKCGRELPYDCFVKNSSYNDGHSGSCKDCDKLYRMQNRERIKQNRIKWESSHTDYHKNYREQNRERKNNMFRYKYNNDINFRLNNCFSRSLHRSLNYTGSSHWKNL